VRLINIGCSFSYGNQISAYETFAQEHLSPGTLLAEHLDCTEYNIASPGLSLDGVLRRLYTFDFEDDDVFFVGLPPNVRLQYVSVKPRNQSKVRLSDPTGQGPTVYRRNAFNAGPKTPIDWFKTMRFDMDLELKQMDLIETTAYQSFFYILLIQQCLANKKYWMYNSVHGHMQQPTEIPEIQVLKDKIDLTHYYQPEYGLLDFANSKEEYCVAQDDSHPNHVCYREWFRGFKDFL
tara:strand:- start:1205 stop:1909 length:705 start_codon:yes stop_codon:yes gene_type:complete